MNLVDVALTLEGESSHRQMDYAVGKYEQASGLTFGKAVVYDKSMTFKFVLTTKHRNIWRSVLMLLFSKMSLKLLLTRTETAE